MHFQHHPTGDNIPGRVGRRADRHEQGDSRGQYPRPRDNQFARQPEPRSFPQPPPEARQPAPPPGEPPPQAVYTENGEQYARPARPYVPDYMRNEKQREPLEPQGFDVPTPQTGSVSRHNPYVVLSEKSEAPVPRVPRRALLIAAVAAAVILAGVWAGQLVFAAQTQAVYDAREAAAQSLLARHPFGYRELIEREAYQNNLNPAFVAAIILNESSFDPYAESYRGARGLMQLMEDTAVWVGESVGASADYSFDQMYDAQTNVEFGCWYLGYLSERFGGDPLLVAAAFHSGQTNVQNWLNDAQISADQRSITLENLPDGNTKTYVERVLNAYAVYRRLYYEEVTL